MTEVKIIADSISAEGVRLTTMQLKFHRIVLAEFNTHRMFSRNASSSRAIPVQTLIKRVKEDPAMPVYWGANQKGMQAKTELEGEALEDVKAMWLCARDDAVISAESMVDFGLHKQLANRILEPWMWCYVVVTATDWSNFFNLRCHPDAQPEINRLAVLMRTLMDANEPEEMWEGDWHLPYVDEEDVAIAWDVVRDVDSEHGDQESLVIKHLQKMSTARCARVSYKTHDGNRPDMGKDIELHDMLLSSGHMSPFEHAAQNCEDFKYHGNFRGWKQYRKFLPGERVFVPR